MAMIWMDESIHHNRKIHLEYAGTYNAGIYFSSPRVVGEYLFN